MNKNPRLIHETVLKDVIDTIDDVKSFVDNPDVIAKKDTSSPLRGVSSIAKASSNLTLVFPVICSRGISIENSAMVSKAIEKNAVTMLQRLFAAYQLQSFDKVANVQDYIRQFHTNLSSQALSLDDIFGMIEESASNGADTISKSYIESCLKNDMKNINYYLPESINETSINDFIVKEGVVLEESKPKDKKDDDENKIEDTTPKLKDVVEYFTKQVADGDFKKANELMPTTMIVNFKATNKDGTHVPVDNALIGVKAKLYPVGSEDIVKHIAEKTSNSNWITNFFRATTREISFLKDFVFALDKAKIDAMSLSTRKSTSDRMWKVLERRATVSRLRKILRSNNSAAAITTLCVSQEEVEYMRKNYNLDLERIPVVLRLFSTLNLMAIVIVDESLEVAKFIYDEYEPMWETISFTHLERESSDNTYKRVVNLMTKVSR